MDKAKIVQILQEEFDERMKNKLGDTYLQGNNDPDTLHEKD